MEEGEALKRDIELESQDLARVEVALNEIWRETLERVAREREIFHSQKQSFEMMCMQNTHLVGILAQVETYGRALSSTIGRHDPRFVPVTGVQPMTAILDQIRILNPNSEKRLQSIETAQNERQNIINGFTNGIEVALREGKIKLRTVSKE